LALVGGIDGAPLWDSKQKSGAVTAGLDNTDAANASSNVRFRCYGVGGGFDH